MNNKQDKLRKAAVLVDSLDPQSADVLLDQMDAAEADRVRHAVLNLGNISPDERELVMSEFLGRPRQPLSSGSDATSLLTADTGIEIEESLAARLAGADNELHELCPTPPIEDLPFRFLHEAAADTIAPFLRNENPQAVAVVLAHLPPNQAADLLVRLVPEQQAEVIRRIAHLDETSPEVLQDVERELGSRLTEQLRTTRRRTAGLTAIHQILQAADMPERKDMLTHLAETDTSLAGQLQALRSDRPAAWEAGNRTETKTPAGKSAGTTWRPASRAAANVASPTKSRAGQHSGSQQQSTTRSRSPWLAGTAAPPVNPAPHAEHTGTTPPASPTAQSPPSQTTTPSSARKQPPAFRFADLEKLNDADLTAVFAEADRDMAVLALTGADNRLVRRIIKQLPAPQAKLLAARLAEPGPMRLSDVEQAQEELGRIAGRLARTGKIQWVKPREQLAMVA